MSYQVFIRKSAIKSLKTIPDPYYSSIKSAILQLGQNPRPRGYIKLKNRKAFRIRVSDYRIIYEINESTSIIDIIAIGHRQSIY